MGLGLCWAALRIHGGQPDSAREHPQKAATTVETPALMGEQERTRVRLAGSAEAGMIELWNLSVLPALGLLAAAGLLGTAALRRVAPFLDLLEQIAYGVPVGVVVVSLGALLLASALELSTGLVAVIGLTSAIGASVLGSDAPWRVRLGLWQWRGSRSGARRSVSSLVGHAAFSWRSAPSA